MTKQQVIDILEAYKPSGNIYNGYNSIEEKIDERICYLIDEIIGRVKQEPDEGGKQMTKKPYFREEEGAKGYACPSCDMGVEIRLFQGGCVKERFCSCCGQALDWSGEDE